MDGVTGSRAVDFLAHYGIKGMRWGVRRSDAELRRARKERKAAAKAEKKEEKQPSNRSVSKKRKDVKKQLRTMSDADLDKFVNRLNTEKKAKDLVEADLTPGRKAAKMIASDTGKKALAAVAAYATVKAVQKKFGDESGGIGDYVERAVKPKKK